MSATLAHLLSPLDPWRLDPLVEEICINRPGEAWVWRDGRFTRHDVALDASEIEDIAVVAGAQGRQDCGPDQPLLSCDLPDGGRLQAVLPPCVEGGKPSLTIRRASMVSPTMEELDARGLFTGGAGVAARPGGIDPALMALYHKGDRSAFLVAAVKARKTIVLCGETASGKTTLAKALINAIPLSERLITIEDTPEWVTLPHENRVALFYSKGDQSVARVTASDLVEASLRMRIGRLLLQELRDGPAAASFLRALASGHPGGITTVHASHAAGAFEAIAIMLKTGGSSMTLTDIRHQLDPLIDVVVHCHRQSGRFGISEIWMRGAEG